VIEKTELLNLTDFAIAVGISTGLGPVVRHCEKVGLEPFAWVRGTLGGSSILRPVFALWQVDIAIGLSMTDREKAGHLKIENDELRAEIERSWSAESVDELIRENDSMKERLAVLCPNG
jgi:hypothetical protein